MPLSSIVENKIKKIIFSGDLPPRSHLNIDDFARRFKCSKTPIREAFKKLVAENLVVYVPKSGYFIKSLSMQEYLKRYELQELLETHLIKKMAEIPRYLDFNKLYQINDNIRSLIDANMMTFVGDENDVFHITLYEKYQNDYIFATLKRIWNEVKIQRNLMFIYPQFIGVIVKEHQTILDALRKGNADDAEKVMRQHYASGREAILYSSKWELS
ncbi:MAG: GntR family transcriptional regulator [Synergistaceae bacterium]|nr:GntR family transcriptional regulator [Synergistaceae bacterium]